MIGAVTVRKTAPKPVSASEMVVLGMGGLPVLLGVLPNNFLMSYGITHTSPVLFSGISLASGISLVLWLPYRDTRKDESLYTEGRKSVHGRTWTRTRKDVKHIQGLWNPGSKQEE